MSSARRDVPSPSRPRYPDNDIAVTGASGANAQARGSWVDDSADEPAVEALRSRQLDDEENLFSDSEAGGASGTRSGDDDDDIELTGALSAEEVVRARIDRAETEGRIYDLCADSPASNAPLASTLLTSDPGSANAGNAVAVEQGGSPIPEWVLVRAVVRLLDGSNREAVVEKVERDKIVVIPFGTNEERSVRPDEVSKVPPRVHDTALVFRGSEVGLEGELVCIDCEDAIIKDTNEDYKIAHLIDVVQLLPDESAREASQPRCRPTSYRSLPSWIVDRAVVKTLDGSDREAKVEKVCGDKLTIIPLGTNVAVSIRLDEVCQVLPSVHDTVKVITGFHVGRECELVSINGGRATLNSKPDFVVDMADIVKVASQESSASPVQAPTLPAQNSVAVGAKLELDGEGARYASIEERTSWQGNHMVHMEVSQFASELERDISCHRSETMNKCGLLALTLQCSRSSINTPATAKITAVHRNRLGALYACQIICDRIAQYGKVVKGNTSDETRDAMPSTNGFDEDRDCSEARHEGPSSEYEPKGGRSVGDDRHHEFGRGRGDNRGHQFDYGHSPYWNSTQRGESGHSSHRYSPQGGRKRGRSSSSSRYDDRHYNHSMPHGQQQLMVGNQQSGMQMMPPQQQRQQMMPPGGQQQGMMVPPQQYNTYPAQPQQHGQGRSSHYTCAMTGYMYYDSYSCDDLRQCP